MNRNMMQGTGVEAKDDNSSRAPGLGGRPRALDRLGLREQDIWNDIAYGLTYKRIQSKYAKKVVDPDSRKTSYNGLGIRTIARIAGRMPKDYEANFDEFSKLPGVANWKRHIKGRNSEWKRYYKIMNRLWEEVWSKKALEDVDDDDFSSAIEYIHENIGDAHGKIALSRFWESQLLPKVDITNFRNDLKWDRRARIIPELMSERFLTELFPAILEKVKKGTVETDICGKPCTIRLTPQEVDEMILALNVKATTGMRTGSRKAGRELWGMKLAGNEGETRVVFLNGKFLGMVVHAKKGIEWYVQPATLPCEVSDMLEQHIMKYDIRSGDYLIQELTPSRAGGVLRGVCRSLGITGLRLHDLRKAYLTGMCLAGVRLEYAVAMNVGWRSIEVARKHYLMVGGENKEREYSKFADKFFDNGKAPSRLHEAVGSTDGGELERMANILRQSGYTIEGPRTPS